MMNATDGTIERVGSVAKSPEAAALPNVVYVDDVINAFHDDDIDLPPRADDDDDHRPEPRCVYADPDFFDDDDFGDLYATERDEGCREKPEYYMRLKSRDPGDDEIKVVYYCPRHFAANLGYLCDTMSRRTPEMEIRRFIDHGIRPPRAAIIDWGPMSALGPGSSDEKA